MYFANSSVLWALLALSIPIIIHLFNFRRFKKVYFSNVALLREIKIDTQSTNRLKHLLVLACRLFALLFLIAAFAQPFLSSTASNKKLGSSAVSIFVDNSYSMNAENKNGALLENAKKAAREIALAYKPSDKFQLLTNDFEGRHQRLFSREEFLEMLDNVQITPISKSFYQINSRQADVLNSSSQNSRKAYVVSDFQKTMYNLKNIKVDTTFSTIFVSFSANEISNIYIDSAWFDVPNHQINQTEILNVRIKSSGSEGQNFDNIPVKLFVNNEQKALASFSIETPSSVTIQLNYTNKLSGIKQCRIELQDHPITFDDNFYITYNVNESIKINCINGNSENNYLNLLFKNDEYCKLLNSASNSIDYSSLGNTNFLILNELKSISSGLSQEVEKYLMNGGSVLVIPSNTIELDSYNNFFKNIYTVGFSNWDTAKTKVERINIQHVLYNDIFEKEKLKQNNIDLPIVFGHYNSSGQSRLKAEPLLQLQNGNNFLYSSKVGKGKIYVSTVPFNSEYSNFVKHALFVPSVYKMAITSVLQNELYYCIGENEVVKVNSKLAGKEELFHIVNLARKVDFIPSSKIVEAQTNLMLYNQIKEANNYEIKYENELLGTLAFNYNSNESNLSCYDFDNLENEISKNDLSSISVINNKGKSLTQTVKEENTGKALWKICLWLSLLFILLEVLLLSSFIKNFFNKQAQII
jgi:hypothetical protein